LTFQLGAFSTASNTKLLDEILGLDPHTYIQKVVYGASNEQIFYYQTIDEQYGKFGDDGLEGQITLPMISGELAMMELPHRTPGKSEF
jgi:hypothetical protein